MSDKVHCTVLLHLQRFLSKLSFHTLLHNRNGIRPVKSLFMGSWLILKVVSSSSGVNLVIGTSVGMWLYVVLHLGWVQWQQVKLCLPMMPRWENSFTRTCCLTMTSRSDAVMWPHLLHTWTLLVHVCLACYVNCTDMHSHHVQPVIRCGRNDIWLVLKSAQHISKVHCCEV